MLQAWHNYASRAAGTARASISCYPFHSTLLQNKHMFLEGLSRKAGADKIMTADSAAIVFMVLLNNARDFS